MLFIEECRKILEQDGDVYTDKEIIEMPDTLYLFAEIHSKNYKEGRYKDMDIKAILKKAAKKP